MPRIVSGLDPKIRLEAYLAGEQSQRRLMEQQAAEKERQQERQARAHQEIMRAMAAHKNEQAKALADANRRAQMGDAQAMQQQNMEAAAANVPPSQKRLQEMAGILSKIEDPDAREFAAKEFEGYHKKIQAHEEQQSASGMIDTAVADGLITPEEGESRKQQLVAGKDPGVATGGLVDIRKKKAGEAVAMGESANALAKADAIMAALPEDSPIRAQMQHFVEAFKGSAVAQQTKGAGQKMLKHLQDMLKMETFKQGVEDIPSGMGAGIMQALGGSAPQATTIGPDIGTHATLRRGQKQQFAPQEAFASGDIGYGFSTSGEAPDLKSLTHRLLAESADELDLAKKLKAAGVPLTPETQAIVRQAMDEKRAALGAAE